MVRKYRDLSDLLHPSLEEKYLVMLRYLVKSGPLSRTEIDRLVRPSYFNRVTRQAVYIWVDQLKTADLIAAVPGAQTDRAMDRYDLTLRGLATLISFVGEDERELFGDVSKKYVHLLPAILDLWQQIVDAGIEDIARRQLRSACRLLMPASSKDLLEARREMRRKQWVRRWRTSMTQMSKLQSTERPEDFEKKYGLNLDRDAFAGTRIVVDDMAKIVANHFWTDVDDKDYSRWIEGIRRQPALRKAVARQKLASLLMSVDALNSLFGELGQFTELLVTENFEQKDVAAVQELVKQIALLNKAARRMTWDESMWSRIRHMFRQ